MQITSVIHMEDRLRVKLGAVQIGESKAGYSQAVAVFKLLSQAKDDGPVQEIAELPVYISPCPFTGPSNIPDLATIHKQASRKLSDSLERAASDLRG